MLVTNSIDIIDYVYGIGQTFTTAVHKWAFIRIITLLLYNHVSVHGGMQSGCWQALGGASPWAHQDKGYDDAQFQNDFLTWPNPNQYERIRESKKELLVSHTCKEVWSWRMCWDSLRKLFFLHKHSSFWSK